MRRLILFVTLVVVAAAGVARALPTRTFVLTSYKDFDEGEVMGAMATSDGEVRAGYGAMRLDGFGDATAYSSATLSSGAVVFGAGADGALWIVDRGAKRPRKLCTLPETGLVTAVAVAPSGTVFAAALPGARVFAVEIAGAQAGKPRLVTKLDAEHVWSLAFDGQGTKTLFAGAGGPGKVWAIDVGNGSKRMVADTGEKHVLSLVRGDGGMLYAGTAGEALLLAIASDGKITALHDFEGEEVRAVARRGTTLYVAVNELTRVNTSGLGPVSTAPRGTKLTTAPVTPVPVTTGLPAGASGSTRDRKGKGAIFRVDADGRVEHMHSVTDGYFSAIYVDSDGTVWAAGTSGKVYQIRADRTVQTVLDLPERQVLTLALEGAEKYLGTGDAGAIYRLSLTPPHDARFTSKVLDAQYPARLGSVRWRGTGALSVSSRTGNTAKPDSTWSAWAPVTHIEKLADGGAGGVGKATSPLARYVQLRVGFGDKAVLRDLTAWYQSQNQRPRVTELVVEDRKPSRGKPRSATLKIRWKADNPDEDELIYTLSYREEADPSWKVLGGPDPLSRTDFEWNTESVPDGTYLLKITASDERANPREDALEHTLVSVPVLVDNRRPEVADLRVSGGVVTGRARDNTSSISELAYSIDGAEFVPAKPKDGILDDLVEDFAFKLPAKLSPGSHSIAVRAVDAADNVGLAQIVFKL